VLTNFNEAITDTTARRWATNLGLVEAITWLHQHQPPPTFQRGSHPIDGIFMAPQLLAQAAGGYLSFRDVVPSDHWAIWVNLHLPEMSSTSAGGYVKPSTHQLQCKDPCIITWYNQLLLDILAPHNVLQQIQHLNNTLHKPSSKTAYKKRTKCNWPFAHGSKTRRREPVSKI